MGFRIQLASNISIEKEIEEDELVVEIYWNQETVAVIQLTSDSRFHIEIYPSQSNEPWNFDLDEWLAVLEKAKQRLSG
jgi:hypothetical protein